MTDYGGCRRTTSVIIIFNDCTQMASINDSGGYKQIKGLKIILVPKFSHRQRMLIFNNYRQNLKIQLIFSNCRQM